MQRIRKIPNETSRHVLNRVLANAVDTGGADPPQSVLNFIARDLGLVLIHIRKVVVEPAVQRVTHLITIGMGRKQDAVLKPLDQMMLRRAVEPVIQRWIADPRMTRTDMISHLILNYFYSQRVRLLDQLPERSQITKVIFYAVVIDCVVAVIVGIWTPRLVTGINTIPVVVPRCQPHRRDSQLFQIRKVIDDAAKITTMIRARVAATVRCRRRQWRRIITAVSVRKPIRHNQVDYVVGVDALKMFGRIERRFNTKGNPGVAGGSLKHERVVAGPDRRANGYVDEQICASGIDPYIGNTQLRPGRFDARANQILPTYQQSDGID